MEGLLVIPGIFFGLFLLSVVLTGGKSLNPKHGLVSEKESVYPKGHPRYPKHLK